MSKINRQNHNTIYVNRNSAYRKWIIECACCHRQGYNPKMPEKIIPDEIGFTGAEHIRHTYEPLVLNEMGLCEVCAKFNN